MKIKVMSIYVDDQEKALRFYTEVLGFAKKADFSNGPYRWLTVASAEEPDGTQLQLALNDNIYLDTHMLLWSIPKEWNPCSKSLRSRTAARY
jgi:catechol 2,3-dioxygenase-like lactoylglutathione lyase family enzyme